MELVFKALSDGSRRDLLDALRDRDGQSLNELCDVLPQMTRYGVMRHLEVLERADLIATRRVGRSKLHYLNPVPIRLVHDRWITNFTEPTVRALAHAKTTLEAHMTPTPAHIHQVFIKAPTEEIWKALVNGEITTHYYYNTKVDSSWQPDSPVTYYYPDGSVAADGTVLAVDPGRRLEMLFHPRWDDEIAQHGPVRMVWLIEQTDGLSRLSVELWDVEPGSILLETFNGGMPFILSGLKTYLETGEPLAS